MEINQDRVPSTIAEAIRMVFESLDARDRQFILSEHSPSVVHHTVGRHIRNEWSLWKKGTPLAVDFQQRFNLFGHPDDISGMIFEAVWAQVREEHCDLQQIAEKFRRHWLEQGINPITGEEK
jgi:hypothetical protein